MRISAITNWAYGVTVVLTALSGAAFIMSSRSAIEERVAVEEHLTLDSLAEDLALGAEVRFDEARLFVMRGEERHLNAFRAEDGSERSREAAVDQLLSKALPKAEVDALRKIETDRTHSTSSRSRRSKHFSAVRGALPSPRCSAPSMKDCKRIFWRLSRIFAI